MFQNIDSLDVFSSILLQSYFISAFKLWHIQFLKSNNLQYNTLDRWVDGTINSSAKCLMFQALFFLWSFINLGHSKLFFFIFVIETIFAKNFARNHENKIILGTSDAWSMSRSSINPVNHIELYWRLSDLKSCMYKY